MEKISLLFLYYKKKNEWINEDSTIQSVCYEALDFDNGS